MTAGRLQTKGRRAAFAGLFVAVSAGATGAQQQPRNAPPAPPPLTSSGPNSSDLASAQCAASYHQALEPLRRDRAPGLGDLLRKVRAAEADLPGRWLYSAQLFQKAKPQKQTKPERICVETKEVRGQERCARYDFKPVPPPPPEITTKAPPGAEELRHLKLLSDVVDGRGAVPDVSANGKQTFLVQRLAQDLRLYVSQPATPVLCAGAGELIEFYSGQIAPVKRRHEELKAAAKKLAELAATRTRDIAVTEGRLYDAALAAVKVIEQARAKAEQAHAAAVAAQAAEAAKAPPGTPAPTPIPAPTLPLVPTLPAKPATPATLTDYAVISLPSQVGEALRPLLPANLVAEFVAERDPMVMLARAQKAILDPDIKPATGPAIEVRDAAIAALRLHEARLYADRYAIRYGEIDTLLTATIAETKAAHGKSCVCRD